MLETINFALVLVLATTFGSLGLGIVVLRHLQSRRHLQERLRAFTSR